MLSMKLQINKKLPKHKSAWLAMALGLLSILEFPLLLLYSLITKRAGATQFGPNIGFVGIIVTVVALVVGTVIYCKGERSWVLWLGYIPAILLGGFWLILLVAELFSAIFNLGF